MSEDNKIQKLIRPVAKLTGIHAKLEQAKNIEAENSSAPTINRIAVIFDDSGSMAGDALHRAKEAVSAYLKSCNPGRDFIAVYPMENNAIHLTNNYAVLDATVKEINRLGGTPMYGTLSRAVNSEPVNHAIVFSDGCPTDDYNKIDTIQTCTSKKIKVDTVFIGPANGSGASVLKDLAERTGGIFMHFTDTSIFAKNMKYLAPTYRAMLADPATKAKIEKGSL